MRYAIRHLGTLLMLAWLTGCAAGPAALVDLATLERPTSPNTYLVCPAGRTVATIDREPPVWPLAVEALERAWLDALADEPRLTRRAVEPEAHRHLLVQRTPVFRFPDLVQLEFVPAPPVGATVCIYSRSVYGYSDLGANRARVEDWLARLVPPPTGGA